MAALSVESEIRLAVRQKTSRHRRVDRARMPCEGNIDAVKDTSSGHICLSTSAFLRRTAKHFQCTASRMCFQIVFQRKACTNHACPKKMMSAAMSMGRLRPRFMDCAIRFLAESIQRIVLCQKSDHRSSRSIDGFIRCRKPPDSAGNRKTMLFQDIFHYGRGFLFLKPDLRQIPKSAAQLCEQFFVFFYISHDSHLPFRPPGSPPRRRSSVPAAFSFSSAVPLLSGSGRYMVFRLSVS